MSVGAVVRVCGEDLIRGVMLNIAFCLCRVKKNGHLELGVHIADVSYFVSSGSLLDREAASRSVY